MCEVLLPRQGEESETGFLTPLEGAGVSPRGWCSWSLEQQDIQLLQFSFHSTPGSSVSLISCSSPCDTAIIFHSPSTFLSDLLRDFKMSLVQRCKFHLLGVG